MKKHLLLACLTLVTLTVFVPLAMAEPQDPELPAPDVEALTSNPDQSSTEVAGLDESAVVAESVEDFNFIGEWTTEVSCRETPCISNCDCHDVCGRRSICMQGYCRADF